MTESRRPSMNLPVSAHQSSSVAVSGSQWHSVAISDDGIQETVHEPANQRPSVVISGNQ